MRPDPDPLFLTPEDRFREVAAGLAPGLLRLHAHEHERNRAAAEGTALEVVLTRLPRGMVEAIRGELGAILARGVTSPED